MRNENIQVREISVPRGPLEDKSPGRSSPRCPYDKDNTNYTQKTERIQL